MVASNEKRGFVIRHSGQVGHSFQHQIFNVRILDSQETAQESRSLAQQRSITKRV